MIWTYANAGSQFQTTPLLAKDMTVRALDLQGNYLVIGVDGGSTTLRGFGYGVRGGMTAGVTSDYVIPSVANDGTILTATAPGSVETVYATYAADGGARWSTGTDAGSQLSTVAIGLDGTLRVASGPDGILYSLNADGALRWSVRTPTSEDNITLFALSDVGTTYVAGQDGMAAFDSNGADAGTFSDGPCWEPLIDAAGNLADQVMAFGP